ncbi:MAG: ImmA/IrrE family metallo-endopeptidase [Devosia sp.]
MGRPFQLLNARRRAEALLRDEGIDRLPVDPFAIASDRDILVQAKHDAEPGVSGMLLRHGNEFGILYATHIKSEGFRRFSVSHELGHFFLDGHVDQLLKDGVHASHAGFVTADPYELEADHFAAGLLMPETPFKAAMNKLDGGLSAIEELADQCITSRTATAIRFAELTQQATAVIVSTGDTIDYCFMSDAMKTLPRLSWLRKGTPLPVGTATAALAANRFDVQAGKRTKDEVDVRDWLGGETSRTVTEESLGLGAYGKVLTVLSSPTIGREDGDDDDEAEEERLVDSWTPRFR